MASRHDISLERIVTNDEPIFLNGDFSIVESDEQHIQDTINAFPSWWKEYPLQGVGIKAWLGSPANIQDMTKAIRLQLQADGYTVTNPKITLNPDGSLIINPNATI